MDALEEAGLEILPWIPKGCDISPIENVWAMLKDHLVDNISKIKNKKDVWEIASDYFISDHITQFIKKVFRSLPTRLRKLRQEKGRRVCFK